ncbi:MAG: ABC transporter ATP-binding protein [Clostridia bacterium]|nr:ABC transporter ATP-binding protein [Clostridia bacterium]
MMPPPHFSDKWKEPVPKKLRDFPAYLNRLLRGTAHRIRYVFAIVWDTAHWILFYMLFFTLYRGVMPVVSSLITAQLLNALATAIINREITSEFYFFLILQFSYLFVNSIANSVDNILTRISGERVSNNIRLRIMNKAREVDLASFDRPEFYERLENANREAGMRPLQILNNMFGFLSTIISIVTFVVALAAILPIAPPIIILISIPGAVINFIFRRKNFNYMRHRSVDRQKMNYYSGLMVNKDLVKEIHLFGMSDLIIATFRDVFERYFGGLKRLILAEGGWNVGLTLITTAVNCVLYILIGQRIVSGNGQIGDFTFYTGALNSIASGVGSLIATSATIYEGTLFIDNLISFMNEKTQIVPLLESCGRHLAAPLHVKRHCAHTIVMEHVCFRYPGKDYDILHDINLTLNAGDTCVLVGLNGAGKTTLIKLLTRLYDPTEGTIYLDGEDLRSYDVSELYAMFGIIFQDFGKYAFSVSDNIAFGDVSRVPEETEIRKAAEMADADTFIRKLPNSYNTLLMRYFSEEGTELSIGQWQKLSIARAFYSDSDILILDEPTASLDAIAEQEIFRQFDELRKDKTTIFVSHRLSSATLANKIVVLENGRLIEEGNHTELMKAKGRYYELFSIQAERYIATAEEGLIDTEDLRQGAGVKPVEEAFPSPDALFEVPSKEEPRPRRNAGPISDPRSNRP